ncbi:MAG: tetratricopeptide repeat protein, partial [Planctomycetes bacterium]|nr:tetratricopeptide repeat protein [Planctomycetota bacterium]
FLPVWVAYFAAAAAIAGIAIHFAGVSGAIRPWHFGGKAPTALFMAWVAVYYVKTMVFPNFLSARYPYGDTADFGVSGWMLGASVVVLAAMAVGVVWLIITVRARAKGHPPGWTGLFAFGTAWFFITLAPVMNFVSINVLVADRYLYLPSVGFLIATAGLLWFVWGTRLPQAAGRGSLAASRWMAVVLCAGLVAADGARTYARNRVWHDSLSLWSSVVNEFPQSVEARLLLASAYAGIEPPEYEKALAEIDRAGKITPLAGKVHLARGKVLAVMGRAEDALSEFARARELGETDWKGQYEARLCEAEALCGAGRLAAAEVPLKQAIALDPSRREAFFALGGVLKRQGHRERALGAYRQAVSRDPKYARAWYNLGKIASQKGDFSAATGYYNKALDADPSYAEAMVNLGVVYLQSGEALRARKFLEEAVRLQPDLAAAHLNLARACGMTGDVARAAGELRRAIELDPDNAVAQELLRQIDEAQKGGE